MAEKTIHIGRTISRLRELRGMKQEALAAELGISQQAISRNEQSEQVEDEALAKIATALGVTPEAIKLFNEEAIFNNIQHNADTATGNTIVNYQFQFNPIEKIVELYDEKVALLERLLQSEREKVEMLKGK